MSTIPLLFRRTRRALTIVGLSSLRTLCNTTSIEKKRTILAKEAWISVIRNDKILIIEICYIWVENKLKRIAVQRSIYRNCTILIIYDKSTKSIDKSKRRGNTDWSIQ